MKFTKSPIYFCLLILSVLLFNHSIGQTFQKTTEGVSVLTDSLKIEISYYNSSIVRIIKSPRDKDYSKKSLSVTMSPQTTSFSIKQNGENLRIKSKNFETVLNTRSGKISFLDQNGQSLLTEQEGGTRFTPFNDAGQSTYTIMQSFVLDRDEAIYGLGQQQQGKMMQRNLTLKMIQGNTDDYIPIFQSVKGYGVFWDNYSPTVFTDKPEGTSFRSDVGDCIDYYFMFGGNADGVIRNIRTLTGQAPLFPLWSFGFFQSRERYKSQDELLEVIHKYR
jgi:alpha-D-xyloside xylohydrolase